MPTDLLLSDYLEEWTDRRRAHLRPSTLKSYRQTVRCYLNVEFAGVHLAELDRRRIETGYSRLLTSGGRKNRSLSSRTVQYIHAVLHRALEDAVLDGLLPENPAGTARAPKQDPGATEVDNTLSVWTAEEAARFLEHVDDHPWRNLWHTALGTGARRGELLGLCWEDVDLEDRQVRIRRALTVVDGVERLLGTKTSRTRTLSVGDSVAEALRRQRERQRGVPAAEDGWRLVFTGDRGEALDPMAVTREFRRLVRDAPVPVIRLHDVRHTHATLLLAAGVPIKTVSERLGHSTITMTMDVYAHVLPAMDRDAAARLERALHG